jgi:hypothetical protein
LGAWYLGDGTRTTGGGGRRAIELCTQSFKKENLENTVIRFLNSISIDCWVNNAGKVYIPNSQAPKFLQYIGECPIKCYEHKWDLGKLKSTFVPPDKDVLYDMYINKKMSSIEISKELNMIKRTVLSYLRKYGIMIRNVKEASQNKQNKNKKLKDLTKERLYKMYIENKMSLMGIELELNISSTTIARRLKRFGIPIRGLKDSIVLPYVVRRLK